MLVGRSRELEQLTTALAECGGALLLGRSGMGRTELADRVIARAGTTIGLLGQPNLAAVELGAFADLVPDAGPAARRIASIAGVVGRADLLAVDDAHLLDATSLAVVEHVLRTHRTAVLLTARAGAPATPGLVDLAHRHGSVVVELGPLRRDEIRTLLTDHLSVEPEHAREIEAAAHGVPGIARRLATGDIDAVLAGVAGRDLEPLARAEREAVELVAAADPVALRLLERHVGPAVVTELERRRTITVRRTERRLTVSLADPVHIRGVRARMGEACLRARRSVLLDEVVSFGRRRAGDLVDEAVLRLDLDDWSQPELFLSAARLLFAEFTSNALAAGRRDLSGTLATASRLASAACTAADGFDAAELLSEIEGHRLNVPGQLAALARLAELATTDEHRLRLDARLTAIDVVGRGDPGALYEEISTAIGAHAADSPARRLLVRLLVLAALGAGRTSEAMEIAGEMIDDPHATRTDRLAVTAPLVTALAVRGRTVQALEIVDAAIAGLSPDDGTPIAGSLLLARLAALSFRADLSTATTLAEQLLSAAEAAEHDLGIFVTSFDLGYLRLAAGQVSEALVILQRARALGDEDGFGYRQLLATIARAHGYSADVRRARASLAGVDAGRVRFEFISADERRAEAWVSVAAGRLDQAVAILRTAAADESSERPLVAANILHDLVRLGEDDVTDDLVRLAGGCDDLLTPLFVAHARALREQDGGALDDAAARFEEAGFLLFAAEAAGQASSFHEAAGANDAAASSARRSADLADRCDGAATPALRGGWTLSELTPREMEVAELAAAGHSDREIADLLHVSVRTVESHLYRTYAKLAVSSRDTLRVVVASARRQSNDRAG